MRVLYGSIFHRFFDMEDAIKVYFTDMHLLIESDAVACDANASLAIAPRPDANTAFTRSA
jgi:hypothetical protein